jgi:hypothetical protein
MADDRADALARAIAGFGLADMRAPETATVGGDAWQGLLSRIRGERMSGLAVKCVASGWLELSDDQTTELLTAHRDAMTWCLSVERKLVDLADAFDSAGIVFAVLKGASVAHTMYADPSLRSFGDLDLLVSTADYERACALLRQLGHVRQRPEPRPGFEVRFGKASVHKHPDDDVEVDLHRTLVLGPFGLWIDPDELLARRVPFLLGGRKLDRLDDTGMLLNVAMHAALGAWPHRLVPLRDVAQVTHTGEVDRRQLERWCAAWHVTAVLDRALALSASLGPEPPPELMRIVRGGAPRERRALQRYEGSRRAAGGTALATLSAIPDLRSKLAYAAALAFPGKEFLEARTASGRRPSYLRRLGVPARWVRSR